MTIDTKQKIGNVLYAIAGILLIIYIYQMVAKIENGFFEIAGWIALVGASAYRYWLSKEEGEEI